VYFVATILIVAGVTAVVAGALYSSGETHNAPPQEAVLSIAVFATLLIIGATLYKTALLSSGGARVARDMGGTLVSPGVQDPLRHRLRNVIEEMAIASGVPVPEIYVLEEENGINAFAAGFSPEDAAIAVTRGCLELLDRDELQGVIAHEFSHILNGDMRLNIRMMGVLFGIMVIGIIGRYILRSSRHRTSLSARRNKNAPVVMIIGLGLALLGWIGVFMARLIKAAVSRQREFLADASAVQFTRQTEGLAHALKKIGGYKDKSFIQEVDPEEVSHMLFAGGTARLTALFATHPPLIERITALDPGFRESNYPEVDLRTRDLAAKQDAIAGFSDVASASTREIQSVDISDSIADAVGRPEPKHVLYAQKLRSSIPQRLYAAAHAPDDALLLAIALSLSSQDAHARQQLRVIADQIGMERTGVVEEFHALIINAGPGYRLPLLEIAFPALKSRPVQQVEFLLDLVNKLIQLDARVDLSEYCFYRILASHLAQAAEPSRTKKGNRVSRQEAQSAAVSLVRIVANHGNDDREARQHAFEAGVAPFGNWAEKFQSDIGDSATVAELDQALDNLSRMNSAGRKSLLQAVSSTVAHDGKLTLAEAELLRTICAALYCPLPPILADHVGVLES